MSKLTRYILLLASITTVWLVLNDSFFQLNHSAIMRNPEAYAIQIALPDGSLGTQYDYRTSPFYMTSHVSAWASFILLPLLTLFLSIKYLLAEVNNAQYIRSLFIPLSFSIVSFLAGIKDFHQAVGAEAVMGLVFFLIYAGITFALVALTGGTIYFFRRQK